MRNKGIGIKNNIIQWSNEMPGGKYYFEIAVILRNAYLISSILSSSEVWYGLTQANYEQLEQTDEMWMRDLFDCSSNVARDLLYLDLGLLQIRHIIEMRRLLYLHHILQQSKDSLLHRFFMAQLRNPTKGDWVSQVLNELTDFQLNLQLTDIENMSFENYKSIVKNHIKEKAFNYLISRKESRTSENSKGKLLKYSKLEMAEYLTATDIDISIAERKWLFKCRVEDIDIKANRRWKYSDISCYSCDKNIPETQHHILRCETLIGQNQILTYIPDYNELYQGSLEEQVYVSRLLRDNFQRIVIVPNA